MAHHLIPNPGPHIVTPLTERLLNQLDHVARRRSDTAATVQNIRDGDNTRLLDLVRRTQAGDPDAAVVAVGSLLPRLTKVILSRTRPNRWKPTIDEYLTLAYLTITDVKTSETANYLADKLISRTRLRHERQSVNKHELPISHAESVPDPSHPVDERVLARLDLRAVASRLRADGVRTEDLATVALAAMGDRPSRPRSQAERQHLARARRRVALGCAAQEAA